MSICNMYLKGQCRFGKNCKNIHQSKSNFSRTNQKLDKNQHNSNSSDFKGKNKKRKKDQLNSYRIENNNTEVKTRSVKQQPNRKQPKNTKFSNSSGNSGNKSVNEKKTLRSNNWINNSDKIDLEISKLFGLIMLGDGINRLSIRIISKFEFRMIELNKFVIKDSNDFICSIFYKNKDDKTPMKFSFELNETNSEKINKFVSMIESNQLYLLTNNCDNKYVWYYNGHIYDSYKTFELLYLESFKNGTISITKKEYKKETDYQIRNIINETTYTPKLLHSNYQIVRKELLTRLVTEEKCSVCFEKESVFAIIPCGHKCLCNDCLNIDQCPICDKNVKGVLEMK